MKAKGVNKYLKDARAWLRRGRSSKVDKLATERGLADALLNTMTPQNIKEVIKHYLNDLRRTTGTGF